MRGLIAIALCFGCYSPTISPGAPCETDCPGALVCIDHVCRPPGFTGDSDAAVPQDDAGDDDAMVPIDAGFDGPPGDGDGDGVPDATDNCPAKPNADQHNEDADTLGDVCDPCPHLAGNAADSDGDGVGDACDPQPTIAKQRIKFFDPFTASLPEWTLDTGVTRVGETLRILTGSSGASAYLTAATGEMRVAMAGTVVSITSPASGEHQISVLFGKNSSGTNYHYTEFYDSGGSAGEISITKAAGSNFTNLAGTAYSGTLPLGAWSMRDDVSVAAQQVGFEARLGGTSYGPYTGNTANIPAMIAAAKLKISAINADVRVDYVIVIETLP